MLLALQNICHRQLQLIKELRPDLHPTRISSGFDTHLLCNIHSLDILERIMACNQSGFGVSGEVLVLKHSVLGYLSPSLLFTRGAR